MGSGGSIPLLRHPPGRRAANAEFILWGPEDVAGSRIHASDESVDPAEIERMVVAQALLIQRFAERECQRLARRTRSAACPSEEEPDEQH